MPLLVTLTNASGLRYRGRDLIIGRAEKALLKEGVKHGRVDIILLNDNDLRKLHRQWMGENTVTDVITFPLIEEPPIYAEIYISVSRARAQAEEYGVTLTNELCRLAVHGALHIAGYDDATEDQRKRMHELENRYIGRV
jgi:probable rRNA maturation factor